MKCSGRMQAVMGVLAAGSMLWAIGGTCHDVATYVNPCGTILNCDPVQWELAIANTEYPDWSMDPTCSIPYQCGANPYSQLSGGITGYGPGPRP